MSSSIIYYLASILLCSVVVAQNEVALSPDLNAPNDASAVIAKDFASFGIQASSFPFYAGNDTGGAVTLSKNLLEAIKNRTGVWPVIRVGGTNGDASNYNPDQKRPVTYPDGPILDSTGVPKNIVLGPTFFEGFGQLSAQWIFGIPFINFNKSNTLTQTKLFLGHIRKDSTINALEMGNEPDLYRDAAKDAVTPPRNYVARWNEYTELVSKNTPLPSPNLWEGLTLARAEGHGDLTLRPIFQAGKNELKKLKSVSTHFYQHTTSTGTGMQATLLNHSYIKEGLIPYRKNIAYLRNNSLDLEYVLGETGRYPVGNGKASPADSNFAATLWTVDMMLQSMVIGVTRVLMQQGVTMTYAAWHPVHARNWTPSVRGPFYAHIFIAETVGKAGKTRVLELKTGDADKLSAYAIYNNDALEKVVIVNMEHRDSSSSAGTSRKITLNGLADSVKSVTINKLSASSSEAQDGISFAGKQWLVANEGRESAAPKDDTEQKSVTNRSVVVEVQSSQAVLVLLE